MATMAASLLIAAFLSLTLIPLPDDGEQLVHLPLLTAIVEPPKSLTVSLATTGMAARPLQSGHSHQASYKGLGDRKLDRTVRLPFCCAAAKTAAQQTSTDEVTDGRTGSKADILP